MVWLMAVGNPELRAAVPFYGSGPPLEDVSNLRAPVLGIYAGENARINGGVPRLEAELMAQQNDYKFVGYPGAATHSSITPVASITQNPPKRPVWKPWIGSKTT